METVSSFRRNQRRRKLGLTLSNTSTVSAETNESGQSRRSIGGGGAAVGVPQTSIDKVDSAFGKQQQSNQQTDNSVEAALPVSTSCPGSPIYKSIEAAALVRSDRSSSRTVITDGNKRITGNGGRLSEDSSGNSNRQPKVTFSSMLASNISPLSQR